MGKNNDTDLAVQIAKVDESNKQAHKRIDELTGVIKAFYSLAGDVKVLAEQLINIKEDVNYVKANTDKSMILGEQLTSMKEDINYVKGKVECYDTKPGKLIDSVKQSVITGIFMIIISAIMALIIK